MDDLDADGAANGDDDRDGDADGDGRDFLAQLSDPARSFDVRPRPVPCVLLLTRTSDADVDPVRHLLAGEGIRSVRLNADEIVATTGLSVAPDGRTVRLGGRRLSPTVTWIRHFSPAAIEGGADAARAAFQRESWQAAAVQLAAASGTAIHLPRPDPLSQLRLARRHGVAVPRTMLTTDPYDAVARFDCPRLVVKAAHHHFVEPAPGRLGGVFPVVVDRDRLSAAGPCPGPPVVVQEYVEHEAELRVYHVAGRIHTFRIGKESPASLWTDPDGVEVRALATPPRVAAATRTLAAAMSLRYAAFDFLVRRGAPVFLEANADGDWRWVERKARTTRVTAAVAGMLAGLHRMALAGPGRVELLGFLLKGAGRTDRDRGPS
ncbi:hypothetical protein [Streptomyces sp. HPF1205]|uniref:hypothetical protein n=1 Tax=Streptomyces sp. HPF1205 TaxID=2873262 RepID=UPI001CECC866|nr:hypothetical protein [Streptomyces sp. HPF1205]